MAGGGKSADKDGFELGPYRRGSRRRASSAAEIIALALSAIWLFGASIFFLVIDSTGAGFDSLRFVMTLLAVFMPVALIWVAAEAARNARTTREESERLENAIDALRQSIVNRQTSENADEVERKLQEIAATTKKTETALATFTTVRSAPMLPPDLPPADPDDDNDQPTLALGTTAEELAAPLEMSDYIRALNFPETAEDKEGFRSLRLALQDRKAALLIQSAQDVLTLLSQDGIYMDDLRPDRARPELWRRFARGERGRTIAALGGIRDRSSLALSSARMKNDPVFRDTVHHFLRTFDRGFVEFEDVATDQDIAALTDTRSARAFMLLGRVTGTFD